MARKKVSPDTEIIDATGLEENEQIVIEDKRTIRKERSVPVERDVTEGEIVFDDEPEEIERPGSSS